MSKILKNEIYNCYLCKTINNYNFFSKIECLSEKFEQFWEIIFENNSDFEKSNY